MKSYLEQQQKFSQKKIMCLTKINSAGKNLQKWHKLKKLAKIKKTVTTFLYSQFIGNFQISTREKIVHNVLSKSKQVFGGK